VAGSEFDAIIRKVVRETVTELVHAEGFPVVVEQRLFTAKDAAHYLGRTVGSFRRLLRSGKVPVVRMDAKLYFDRVDLDNLISSTKEYPDNNENPG
jgi:hypothetical protein